MVVAARWATILHTLGLASAALVNTALVFVKPHAATDACEKFVVDHLAQAGVRVVGSGVKLADEIESEKLIDQHYYSIASKATIKTGSSIPVPAEKFAAFFHEEWSAVCESGRAYNALEACKLLGLDADDVASRLPVYPTGVQKVPLLSIEGAQKVVRTSQVVHLA